MMRQQCIVMYSEIGIYTLTNNLWFNNLNTKMYRCIDKRKIFFEKIK